MSEKRYGPPQDAHGEPARFNTEGGPHEGWRLSADVLVKLLDADDGSLAAAIERALTRRSKRLGR